VDWDDVAEFFDGASGFFALQGVGQLINWFILVPNGIVFSKEEAEIGAFVVAAIFAGLALIARMEALDRLSKRTAAEEAARFAAMQRGTPEPAAVFGPAPRPSGTAAPKPTARSATAPKPAAPTGAASKPAAHTAAAPKPATRTAAAPKPAASDLGTPAGARQPLALSSSARPKTLEEIEAELRRSGLPALSPELRAQLRRPREP
jgi:hypothetical protein